jgi:flavin reductase ActVB
MQQESVPAQRGWDRDRFREAMASFPSGATIVTTSDAAGRWWGFTASSFCSVSLDPPLVLTCLSRSAQCFPAFASADRWNVHVLPHRHADLAVRFATRGADKFDGSGFITDAHSLPLLADVSVWMRCAAHAKVEGGDHLVLMGQVEEVALGEEMPFVYFRRKFHSLESADDRAADGGDRVLASLGYGGGTDPQVALVPVVFELDIGWV